MEKAMTAVQLPRRWALPMLGHVFIVRDWVNTPEAEIAAAIERMVVRVEDEECGGAER
jgi:hypothetical protein